MTPGWGRIGRGAMPAMDRWHVGLSKLQWRHAIRRQTRVAGLTAGLANRPLENDRQTRRSPRPARHEKHKRVRADRRLRDSLSKNCYAGRQTRLPLVRQRLNYSDRGCRKNPIPWERTSKLHAWSSEVRSCSPELQPWAFWVHSWSSDVQGRIFLLHSWT